MRAGQFRIISRKGAMDAKGNSILNFVIFVSFVVKSNSLIGHRGNR